MIKMVNKNRFEWHGIKLLGIQSRQRNGKKGKEQDMYHIADWDILDWASAVADAEVVGNSDRGAFRSQKHKTTQCEHAKWR